MRAISRNSVRIALTFGAITCVMLAIFAARAVLGPFGGSGHTEPFVLDIPGDEVERTRSARYDLRQPIERADLGLWSHERGRTISVGPEFTDLIDVEMVLPDGRTFSTSVNMIVVQVMSSPHQTNQVANLRLVRSFADPDDAFAHLSGAVADLRIDRGLFDSWVQTGPLALDDEEAFKDMPPQVWFADEAYPNTSLEVEVERTSYGPRLRLSHSFDLVAIT